MNKETNEILIALKNRAIEEFKQKNPDKPGPTQIAIVGAGKESVSAAVIAGLESKGIAVLVVSKEEADKIHNRNIMVDFERKNFYDEIIKITAREVDAIGFSFKDYERKEKDFQKEQKKLTVKNYKPKLYNNFKKQFPKNIRRKH